MNLKQCPKQLFTLWVKVCHMELLDLIRFSMIVEYTGTM